MPYGVRLLPLIASSYDLILSDIKTRCAAFM